MPLKLICLLVCLFSSAVFSFAQENSPHFLKIEDGVIIYPDAKLSGGAAAVRLQVISNEIIKVSASSSSEIEEKSLIVLPQQPFRKWSVKEDDDNLILQTDSLIVAANIKNGAVAFSDRYGKPIINERSITGRKLQPAVFVGQPLYHVSQTFETTADDAYYGLGQHQAGQFNYKDQQVFLFQNNTQVAVPFLISSKNYGILWDNYSLTTVGDVRPFMPLHRLKLFSKDGDEGWLTASYSNDKNNPSAIAFTKAESSIDYEFLNDSKLHLPTDFKVANGLVTYEGSIASDFDGVHKFRLTYGGYIKLWIDGKLLVDRWRVAWNPAIAMLNIPFEKGKKYSIKIEWIPDGGESYLSLKWLNPIPEKDKNTYTFSSEAGKQLNYYFIYGDNMDEVISGYRQLTGKATMIPKWTFGFWQSRERYKTQDEILSTVAELRKRKIPLDNIVEDWSYWKENDWGSQKFDASRFSNPDSMINVLHKKYHTHFMISVWPKFYEGIPEYEYFNKNGWLYKRNVADRQKDWIGKGYVSTFYDAFNPGARKAFWDLLNERLYSKGVDAWWMDASEPDILSNVSPEKRKEQMRGLAIGPAAGYLNAYPFENAKGIYEGQRSVDSNKRVFILTRSAFAGQQRFAAATWSGDIAARWEDMEAQIPAGINFSMSGIPYWTMDIGGFAVERRYEHPNEKDLAEWREQMTRWYQFGAFCPLFRVHGQFPYREIYNTAPEDHPAYKSMLFYDNLRYRLMPYIYSLAGAAYHNNYTIMRGLVMDFSQDSLTKNIGDQYMYGPSLLINPVYTYKALNRKVYLPSGQGWYDLYSGKYTGGGQNITADAPYERMPVFVKEGSIIPFGPAMQYTNEKPEDPITLFVYIGEDAHFNLYEDADTTYDYERGAYSNIPISYNELNKALTIGKREGAFPGMLKNRSFKIIWITKDSPKPLNPDQKEDATVKYTGKEIIIKMK